MPLTSGLLLMVYVGFSFPSFSTVIMFLIHSTYIDSFLTHWKEKIMRGVVVVAAAAVMDMRGVATQSTILENQDRSRQTSVNISHSAVGGMSCREAAEKEGEEGV